MRFPSTFLAPELLAQETTAAKPIAAPRQLITQAVDETRLTVLKGNTHRLARPEFDQGTAPATLPMQRMLLVLKRSPQQEAALRKLLDDQQDKASPSYHKWLTPAQFGQQFGPADGDMQAITSWLQSHGFQVGSTKGRSVLEFSGSASQVQEAFHTAIHKYAVHGEEHWANSGDPSIPTALTPAVSGVLTLHNFLKKPSIHVGEKRIPAKLVPGSRPQFTSSTGLHALSPEDYGIIYNYTATEKQQSGIDGTGVTIAVVGRSNLFNGGADIANFRSVFGLPSNQTNIVLNGPDPGDLGGDEEAEATLDSSWSAALASGATVDLVVSATTNTTDGIDLSELYIVESNLGNVMTESFGSCEADTTSSDAQGISQLAEQAAAQGISYMVSTGDTGAAGCDDLSETTALGPVSVNVLASTPLTVGVGGTMFNENGLNATYWNTTDDGLLGSAKSYIPEDVWNETCTTQCQEGQPPLAAGAGGVSVFFSKPSWQSGVTGIPADGFRDLPDVSLTAAGHDPYLLCIEGSCVPDAENQISFAGIEGTSASAPSFAGIMALVDEKMGQVQPPSGARQGLPNYVLYPLAATQQANTTLTGLCNASDTTTLPNSACVFNDVTVGNNSVPGETGYPTGTYSAGVGYDLASGLGSVNVSNLIGAWDTAIFRATTTLLKLNGVTTPISAVHGQQVNVSIAVSANSGTPAGDVSLVTSTGQSVPLVVNSGQPVFTLSGGSVAAPTMQLPGGSYSVSAHYAGNGTFAPSDSTPPIAVTVTSENSTTTISAVDQNLNPIVGNILPFGSFVFVRADVVGQSGQGTPTGMVNFVDSLGNLPGAIFNPVANPVPLNSQGNTSIGAGVINFDAGSHSISATYQPGATDLSFSTSKSTQPVTFTIQPGFAGVSGPANVTVTSPGASGTSTVGFIASSTFTTAISFTCSGLPAEAACNSTAVPGSGPNTIVNTNITVTTTAAHVTMLQLKHPRYHFAAILFGSICGGGVPLAGIFLLAAPKRRCWSMLLGLLVLGLVVTLPACGGGGGSSSHQQTQDPGTPAGTYTVTLTATAGSLSEQATFTLTVQ
jgi:subtilase family serine protease